MKRENFYRRDPNKALSGMIGLSLEERGVYNTIIDLLYQTWRPLEDDRRFIANWCGCAVQKLNPIINRLIERGRLITFEEGGRAYLSDEAFEIERNAVKGGSGARSGRREVEEKSAGVREKSAGVEQNSPLPDIEVEENQGVEPLEKTREDKRDANASFVGTASPVPTDAPSPKGKRRVYPEAFEAAWKAYPHHENRSSKPNSLAEWKKLPAEEREGLVAAIERFKPKVETVCGGKGARCMSRWLKDGLHLNWMEGGSQASAPTRTWSGPADVRAAILTATDPEFVVSYLDPCEWREGPPRVVVAPNEYVASRLRKEAGRELDRLGIELRAKKTGGLS